MKTSKLGFKMTPQNLEFEIEFNGNQIYSINILRTDKIAQYIENLSELLPVTYPDVHVQSNGRLCRLRSENSSELLTVFEALLEAIFQVEIIS